MLGVGIGVATLDPGTGDNPAASTFSIAAGIWYVVSGLIAAFAGGYVAARMSGKTAATSGALHGLTTWAVTTLLVLYFLTSSVGALVGGVFSGVSGAIGGVSSTIAQTAGPALQDVNPLDAIEGQVAATGTDPEALQANAVNALRALATSGPDGADQARQEAAEALAQARSIPLTRHNSRSQRSSSGIVMRSRVLSRQPPKLPTLRRRALRPARSWHSSPSCSVPAQAGSVAGQASFTRSMPTG